MMKLIHGTMRGFSHTKTSFQTHFFFPLNYTLNLLFCTIKLDWFAFNMWWLRSFSMQLPLLAMKHFGC